MNWRVAEAKQKFSDLIRAATEEPQLIYNRNHLVAAVVEAKLFEKFLAWHEQQQKVSLGSRLAEFRELCAEEEYFLEVPVRQDRPNAFESISDDAL